MIVHKTFTHHDGVTYRGMVQAQQAVREKAEAFMSSLPDEDAIINVTESALPSTWSKCLVSVTVWYRT